MRQRNWSWHIVPGCKPWLGLRIGRIESIRFLIAAALATSATAAKAQIPTPPSQTVPGSYSAGFFGGSIAGALDLLQKQLNAAASGTRVTNAPVPPSNMGASGSSGGGVPGGINPFGGFASVNAALAQAQKQLNAVSGGITGAPAPQSGQAVSVSYSTGVLGGGGLIDPIGGSGSINASLEQLQKQLNAMQLNAVSGGITGAPAPQSGQGVSGSYSTGVLGGGGLINPNGGSGSINASLEQLQKQLTTMQLNAMSGGMTGAPVPAPRQNLGVAERYSAGVFGGGGLTSTIFGGGSIGASLEQIQKQLNAISAGVARNRLNAMFGGLQSATVPAQSAEEAMTRAIASATANLRLRGIAGAAGGTKSTGDSIKPTSAALQPPRQRFVPATALAGKGGSTDGNRVERRSGNPPAAGGNTGAGRPNPMDQLQGQLSGSGLASVSGDAGRAGIAPALPRRAAPSPDAPARPTTLVTAPAKGGISGGWNGTAGNSGSSTATAKGAPPAGGGRVGAAPRAPSGPVDYGGCAGCRKKPVDDLVVR